MACKITPDNIQRHIYDIPIEAFIWIEAKSGNSSVSYAQRMGQNETLLPVKTYRAEGVWMNKPQNIGIEFEDIRF